MLRHLNNSYGKVSKNRIDFVFLITLLILSYVITMLFLVKPSISFKLTPNKNQQYILLPLLIKSIKNHHLNEEELLFLFSNGDITFNNALITTSITKRPQAKVFAVNHLSMAKIQKKLALNPAGFSISYPIAPNLWLNYSEKILSDSYSRVSLFFFMGILCLFLLAFYAWASITFIRPLQLIRSNANNLGLDINSLPTKIYGTGLVKETASALQIMQARIKELVTHRTQMLATISHDIRTPITRMRLKTYLLDDKVIADKFITNLNEIESMISGILDFSKNDHSREKKSKFDICGLLSCTCYEFMDMGKSVKLTTEPRYLPFKGSKNALKRCFMNLIQNAIKYAGTVEVGFQINDTEIHIQFTDTGPGIPEAEFANVFKPFYRTEQGKHIASTGSGIGLTLVKEVIYAHQGTIRLENHIEGGLIVNVFLPIS